MNQTAPRNRKTNPLIWLTLLLSSFVFSAAQPHNAPLITLDDLQAGMKGEVWTVFKGSNPEPFGVQVTGILRNALGPGKSMILCELTDQRVQSMGAVAGMSGSPLYIDGKLAGVLAYQIQRFETVRYAGFTPI
ncbi:MAG TPA: SpoIVB peptidase S55 domain-containing protein, partial [Lacunisphaera sp.]|nr:SpoIVB peptidase S55 domain-containing protein [Lacunisphaera sp.]